LGVDVEFVKKPLPASLVFNKLEARPMFKGTISGTGKDFHFDYRGADSSRAINRLLKGGAKLELQTVNENGSNLARIQVSNIARQQVEVIAQATGISVRAVDTKPALSREQKSAKAISVQTEVPRNDVMPVRAPRLGVYQAWTSNMDEGWTRWVLEQYEFAYTTLHNADIRAGKLRDKFDVILLPDQQQQSILTGTSSRFVRPEYRGGIGDEGVRSVTRVCQTRRHAGDHGRSL
jgi:hypothetical protein